MVENDSVWIESRRRLRFSVRNIDFVLVDVRSFSLVAIHNELLSYAARAETRAEDCAVFCSYKVARRILAKESLPI
jgi:hypothetical protein